MIIIGMRIIDIEENNILFIKLKKKNKNKSPSLKWIIIY